MIILSISERDPGEVRRLLASPPEGVDAVEVRLDLLKAREPSGWFPGPAVSPRPVIATCRRRADGGEFAGGEKGRREALLAAARAGVAYVDVEHGSALEGSIGDLAPAKIILSHHDRRRTQAAASLAALYRRMARVPGVAVVKIVTTAADPLDVVTIRDLLARAAAGKTPLAAFAMGELGVASRILAPSWGSWATYVALRDGRASAPGQLTLAEALGTYRVEEIDGETRLAGITGYPVSHSLSPAMHNAAYAEHKLNFRYLPFASPKADAIPKLIRKLRLRGLSVTAPHKIAIVKKMQRLDPAARRLGAVNTIVNDGKRLFGFNTDADGLMNPLRLRIDPSGMTVAIVGAGGSARALAVALREGGAEVLIASRRERPGREMARATGARYVELKRLARASYDILINATPAGMDRRGMPVGAAAVKGQLVAELVYRPPLTPLLTLARARGIQTISGLDVLLSQGIEQYALFTGLSGPVETMRGALSAALARAGEVVI
ncbi:MAG: type I 3-dehydroquinate dehydratase [Acidobacteria bacterium]|nr:type I 3-dehydroquinate dehydratase [Acidobacteriota bacterium]